MVNRRSKRGNSPRELLRPKMMRWCAQFLEHAAHVARCFRGSGMDETQQTTLCPHWSEMCLSGKRKVEHAGHDQELCSICLEGLARWQQEEDEQLQGL